MNRGYTALPEYAIQLCVFCQTQCAGPLSILPCNCRVPVHPTCYAPFLMTRQICAHCQTHWNLFPGSSTSSTISVPVTTIGNTEIRYSSSKSWCCYSIVLGLLVLLVIFILLYIYKQ